MVAHSSQATRSWQPGQPRRPASHWVSSGSVAHPAAELRVGQRAADPFPDVPANGQPGQLEGGHGLQVDGLVEHHLGVDAAPRGRPAAGGGDAGDRPPGQQVACRRRRGPSGLAGQLTSRPRRTPWTRSSSRLKPVPAVRLRSSTVSPPPCASQLKSRRPVSGPSSTNPGTVEVDAAAGADGVVRVSRPAANALATTARTSRPAPTAPAAGSRARSRLAARSARPGWGCPGRAAGTASSSRPHTGQDPPGRAARSSSQRGHHACLPPPMVPSSRSAGRGRWC